MRKHRILFAAAGILLAVMLVLSSCAGKEPERTAETAPETVQLETAQESQIVKVGMTSDEVRAALDAVGAKYYSYGEMIFFEDPDGMNGIAYTELKDNFQVAEVDTFPRVQPTSEAFSSVRYGMPVAALVRTVGLPTDSLTSGFASICFNCADGTRYSVYIENDKERGMSDVEYYWHVTSVLKITD